MPLSLTLSPSPRSVCLFVSLSAEGGGRVEQNKQKLFRKKENYDNNFILSVCVRERARERRIPAKNCFRRSVSLLSKNQFLLLFLILYIFGVYCFVL